MRINKYFLAIVFSSTLFFSVQSAQAVCQRTADSNGEVGNCCDETLNQAQCTALPANTSSWVSSCSLKSCGFSAPPASTNGCCVLDTISPASPTNCRTNVASAADCTGVNTEFFPNDPTCTTPPARISCGVFTSNPNDIGCCIITCTSNVKRSACAGQLDTAHPTCKTIFGCDAAVTAGTTASTTFDNPLGSITSISALVANVLGNLKGVIATVAILVIVIGGLMYILSAGDEKKITTAKNIITAAVIGLAIVLAAPTFLVELQRILGGGTGVDTSGLGGALTLKDIVTRTLNLLLSIVGILAIIGLVIGGSFYLTAYGDDKRIETGKKIITSSIIGIIIVMGALVIVKQIASLLGVQ